MLKRLSGHKPPITYFMSSVECVPHFGKHNLVLSTVGCSLFAKWMKNNTYCQRICGKDCDKLLSLHRVAPILQSNQKKKKSFWNRVFHTHAAREHMKNFPPSQPGSHSAGSAAALLVMLSSNRNAQLKAWNWD